MGSHQEREKIIERGTTNETPLVPEVVDLNAREGIRQIYDLLAAHPNAVRLGENGQAVSL